MHEVYEMHEVYGVHDLSSPACREGDRRVRWEMTPTFGVGAPPSSGWRPPPPPRSGGGR